MTVFQNCCTKKLLYSYYFYNEVCRVCEGSAEWSMKTYFFCSHRRPAWAASLYSLTQMEAALDLFSTSDTFSLRLVTLSTSILLRCTSPAAFWWEKLKRTRWVNELRSQKMIHVYKVQNGLKVVKLVVWKVFVTQLQCLFTYLCPDFTAQGSFWCYKGLTTSRGYILNSSTLNTHWFSNV